MCLAASKTLPTCGEVLRALLLVIVLSIGAGPADARSLKVTGTAGLLSEWEFNGEVTETLAGGIKQFSGPLNWKHVGLCSPNGPEEKSGQIQFQVSESRASSKIDVTLRLEDAAAVLDAPKTRVPVSLLVMVALAAVLELENPRVPLLMMVAWPAMLWSLNERAELLVMVAPPAVLPLLKFREALPCCCC